MPAKRQPARRTTPARRRKPTARTTTRKHPARRVKIPRSGPLHARAASWLVLRVVVPMVADRRSVMTARKAAAIRRATHEGCPTCRPTRTRPPAMPTLPEPKPTATAAGQDRDALIDQRADQFLAAINDAAATYYRDDRAVPKIGTAQPVPQPGIPPQSRAAVDY